MYDSIINRYKIGGRRRKEDSNRYDYLISSVDNFKSYLILKRCFHLEANDSNFLSIPPRSLLSFPTVIRSDMIRWEFSNRRSAAVTWRARSSCVKQRWFLGSDRSREEGRGLARILTVVDCDSMGTEILGNASRSVGFARTLKRAYVGTWSIDARKRKPDVKREPRNLPPTLKASSSWKQSSPK